MSNTREKRTDTNCYNIIIRAYGYPPPQKKDLNPNKCTNVQAYMQACSVCGWGKTSKAHAHTPTDLYNNAAIPVFLCCLPTLPTSTNHPDHTPARRKPTKIALMLCSMRMFAALTVQHGIQLPLQLFPRRRLQLIPRRWHPQLRRPCRRALKRRWSTVSTALVQHV